MRFTVQQLSRYFGFRSFKKWDVLHDVFQDNFSFIEPSNSPLELGDVANIKKLKATKSLLNALPISLRLFTMTLVLGIVRLLVMELYFV